MDITRRYMLERVLGILDPEMVSDERIEAFHEAAALYGAWIKEVYAESVGETVEQ